MQSETIQTNNMGFLINKNVNKTLGVNVFGLWKHNF